MPLPRNRLLRSLPNDELHRIWPMLELVPLRARRLLHPSGTPMKHIYFIESGLVSVLANISGTKAIETWLIGSEGLTGVPLILGNNRTVHRRAIQMSGVALRMPSDCVRMTMEKSPIFQRLMLQYVSTILVATSQLAACNAGHSVSQRLVRCLLLARDRCENDDLPLTHEMLSRVVGVRRASITERLNDLERQGLISTRRGLTRIKDRKRLEELACPCYSILRCEYDRLFQESSVARTRDSNLGALAMPRPEVIQRRSRSVDHEQRVYSK